MDNTEDKKEEILEEVVEETETISGDLMKQLAEAQSLAEKHKNEYLLATADLENFRRRVIREKDEIRKSTVMGVVETMLPMLDNMKLGLESAAKTAGAEEVVKGFSMVADQMKAIFGQLGVVELNPQGEAFDPNKHECVAHLPHETVPENNVIEVTRVGYMMKDRLLRPAYVVVSSGVAQTKETGE